eukprot:720516-Pyramimonas_sp.AAC.1
MDWGSAAMGLERQSSVGSAASGNAQARGKTRAKASAKANPSKPEVQELIRRPAKSKHVQKPAAYTPGAHCCFSLPSCAKVGSACSGMGTDHLALNAIKSRNFEFEFWCECDKS